MRISVLDGSVRGRDDGLADALTRIEDGLTQRSHTLERMVLADLRIIPCIGCFGCWVKTPGACVVEDDTVEVRRSVIASDLTIVASPLIMGFVSAVTKLTMDKLIPLLHPYFAVVHGETHHRRRYERYPDLGVLLAAGDGSDADDVAITRRLFERFAINFHSRLRFVLDAGDPTEEVIDGIEVACGVQRVTAG
jgi:multimeric flavodoxin WrbA